MDTQPTDDAESARRTAAIERLKNRRGFWQDLVCYLVFNGFLVGVWYVTSPEGYFWPAWVMAAWGVGVVMHFWSAFLQKPITEDDVQREMDRGGPAVA